MILKPNVEEVVLDVFKARLGFSGLTLPRYLGRETRLGTDIDIQPIDRIMIAYDLEKQFAIPTIPQVYLNSFSTVGDFISFLEK